VRTRCRSWWIPSIPTMLRNLKLDESYKAEELFDEKWPVSNRNWLIWRPRATGGWAPTRTPTVESCCTNLRMPDFHVHAMHVPSPGAVDGQDTLVLGKFLRDVAKFEFRISVISVFSGPDETLSNLLGRF